LGDVYLRTANFQHALRDFNLRTAIFQRCGASLHEHPLRDFYNTLYATSIERCRTHHFQLKQLRTKYTEYTTFKYYASSRTCRNWRRS
jgi:hypothetical protein